MKRRRRKAQGHNGFPGSDLSLTSGALLVLLVLIPAALLVVKAQTSTKLLLPASLLALFGGLFAQYRRITQRWTTVFWTALVALGLSYLAFLPGKHERVYDMDVHIQIWPYVFCGFFLLIAIIEHKSLVTPRLHEGMTLLQTVALAYWALDAMHLNLIGPWTIVLLVALVSFGLFVVVHAFTSLSLSPGHRFVLSLWSSVIMLFLAIDNLIRVYALGSIEETEDPISMSLIVANHFLLGTSSIQMAQNTMMLLGFLPSRGRFFNRLYFKETRELVNDHIDRYADHQVPFGLALMSFIYAAGLFSFNQHYGLVRSNFAIWVVFVTFPWVAWFAEAVFTRRR